MNRTMRGNEGNSVSADLHRVVVVYRQGQATRCAVNIASKAIILGVFKLVAA